MRGMRSPYRCVKYTTALRERASTWSISSLCLTMVKRCAAADSSNTYKDGVSLFLFPKDPELRKKWADQVKRTRDKWDGPTDHSVLCSNHFDERCFEAD